MKGLVIYDSSYGNTREIAETITQTLKDSGLEAAAAYVKDIKKLGTKEYDFLVIGSPTRLGTMSFAIKGFLGKLKSAEWENKPFASFDTELRENIEKGEGSAAEKIAARLKEKGMRQLLPALKTVVQGKEGPLQDGETERAMEFARTIAAELKK